MAAAHYYHRMLGRRAIQIVAVGKPLLGQLALMPVRVGDDHPTRGRLTRGGGDPVEDVLDGPCGGKVHPGAAPDAVIVVVRQSGQYGMACQIDHARSGSGQPAHLLRRSDCDHPVAPDRESLDHAGRAHRQDLPAPKDQIRRCFGGSPACASGEHRQDGDHP